MLLRSIALCLALILSMGTLVQFSSIYSEAGSKTYQKKKKKKVKKYSKAWWKWYRAKLRREKILAARKRNLKARQARLARNRNLRAQPSKSSKVFTTVSALPTGDPVPRGWQPVENNAGEIKFLVEDDNGRLLGTASISMVGFASSQNEMSWGRNKTLAGVSFSALRRIVIDKMMREQGWIVNDYQKEIGGRKVFVVVAQTPSPNGSQLQRLFYFTEVDGRIYNLATNTSTDMVDRIAEQTERVISSFGKSGRSVERAGLR